MATSFLWSPGTNSNGLQANAFNFINTGMDGLTNGNVAVSALGGSLNNGVFKQTDTAGSIWGELFLQLGAIGVALQAGANIAGWFVESFDGGTNFEQSSVAELRAPDFLIPLPATVIAGGAIYKASGLIRLPALPFKVMVQNNTGQTLAGAGANSVKCAPLAVQY